MALLASAPRALYFAALAIIGVLLPSGFVFWTGVIIAVIILPLTAWERSRYKRSRSKKVTYYLTSARVVTVIEHKGVFSPYVISRELDAINHAMVTDERDGAGNIWVGDEKLPEEFINTGLYRPERGHPLVKRSMQYGHWLKCYDDPARYMTLFAVPDAHAVAELIMKTKEMVCE